MNRQQQYDQKLEELRWSNLSHEERQRQELMLIIERYNYEEFVGRMKRGKQAAAERRKQEVSR